MLQPPVHRHAFGTDLDGYFLPSARFIAGELARGSLPLWNPFQLAGQPFLALHVTSPLYPSYLLLLRLLDPETAVVAHAVLHLGLAGLFSWLLCARLGLTPPARLAAAVVYMFSARLLLGVYSPINTATEAWLPALLWAVHGLASEGRLRWALALAGLLALSFLGGYAQTFLYGAQLAAAFGVFAWLRLCPPGARLRVLTLAGLAGVLALGLVAPQLLPTLEHLQGARRSLAGLDYADASWPATHPRDLLAGLGGGAGREGLAAPLRHLVALPWLTLPLALLGLASGRRAELAFFGVAAVLLGLFMLGDRAPVFALYYALPLGDVFRGPIRIASLYLLCAAMLVALGTEGARRLLARRPGKVRASTIVAWALAALVAADAYGRTRLDMALPSAAGTRAAAPEWLVRLLRRDAGLSRAYVEPHGLELQLKFGTARRVFAVPDWEPSMPGAYWSYFDIRLPIWEGKLRLSQVRDVERLQAWVRLLDLLSVRYYVSLEEGGLARVQRWAGLRTPYRPSRARPTPPPPRGLYFRPQALPRAYAVERVEVEPDPARARARLVAASFEPRTTAVVERSLPGLEPGAPSGPDAAPGPVAIESYESTRVVLRAHCDAPCLVVLTDLAAPGWEARLDGEVVPIARVNTLFRGVAAPPGEHEVSFAYRPASLRAGWLGFAGALALAAVAAYGTARKGARAAGS